MSGKKGKGPAKESRKEEDKTESTKAAGNLETIKFDTQLLFTFFNVSYSQQ